ncbi:MAG: hypothetical protein WC114_08810 [Smithellaceae bacterium]|jgi:hypothetical protein
MLKSCVNCVYCDLERSFGGDGWFCKRTDNRNRSGLACRAWGKAPTVHQEPKPDTDKTCANCRHAFQSELHPGEWLCSYFGGSLVTLNPCGNWEPMNYLPNMTKPKQAFNTQVGGDHYKDYAIQPCEFLRANNVPHAEGEVIYKVLRHREKNGREDLEKAIHAIQLIIDMDYPKG